MAEEAQSRGRPTITDVAKAAGVSRALVSIALRGAEGASVETRSRVLAIANEMGYRPDRNARLLRRRRTGLIGAAVDPAQEFHTDLIPVLYAAAARRGYDLVMSAVGPSRTEAVAVEDLVSDRCEGIVLIGTRMDDIALAALGQRSPTVSIGAAKDAIDSVAINDEQGMGLIINHLVGLGHRHIVHLDGGDAPSAAARNHGYETAMAWHKLQPYTIPCGETERDGATAARRMLTELPTAVVAFNDRSAIGVIGTLQRCGVLVPGDISVAGFDDSAVSSLPYNGLTTVAQDLPGLASAALDRLIGRIDETERQSPSTLGAQRAVLPATLHLRTSTGAPRS